ncbi:MAG TPA: hypothetical protein VHW23_42145 [Kofleriaceae bacterium]|jgi:uncharacterized delta-60 repeat protein|nr:hypothetical protein [Kofleriaceae bacterium]
MSIRSTLAFDLVRLLVGASLLVGCSSSSSGTSPDAGGADAPPGGDGGGSNQMVHIVPISTTGHDRLFGVAFDTQGNIYATGQVAPGTDTATDYASVVVKFTPTGALDPTFGDHGVAIRNVAVGTNGELFRGIVIQSTGKIVVSGSVEHAGATDPRDRDIALLRYNPDGTPDASFGNGGVVILDLSPGVVVGTGYAADSVWGLAAYPDDRLALTGGRVRAGATDTDYVVIRLTKDGVPDPGFATDGVFALDRVILDATNGNAPTHNNASPRNISLLPGTAGIIAAGYQPIPGRDTEPVVYKLTDRGELDTTFATGGVFDPYLLDEQAETYAARLQGDKLVTTGYGRSTAAQTTDILSLRLNADGTLDSSYGTGGMVRIDVGGFADNSRNLAILPDGRIVLSGGGRPTADNVDGFIALLRPDGQPDTTFSPTGWTTIDLGGPADFLWSVALSPDARTLAFVGFKGVGANPTPATANDDAALLLLPVGS